ncbi:branched-chain amino acid ABC transporter ATP-binding protein/permease [Streptomyces sp. SID13031]|uniref:branched-chain amino acid ABC transporter ATP-binding protein/permease n=1 Tax=Streptomyces sp. SID13031 TaxID=2706046 RepID=UPI0013C8A53F|nr:branched-chain amino acid ABC transporter ATP-binding protein/permease [Streptomyces sp. SID13031]NEA32859.1 branched-chain amino acid ABC transporter ATP-binding protein/permease [Streptomyces sp. SID13031]
MTAGTRVPRRLPKRSLVALGILVAVAIPFLTPSSYIHNVLILTFLLGILGSGWNVMSGFTGYVSLGHSVFIGIGAYTAGILAGQWGVSPFVVAPLGGVAAALLALLLGWATRRTRGVAFVIVSYAMLELLGLIVRNWSSLTGGSQGLLMPLPDWDVRFHNWPFYYALLALLLLSVAMTAAIRRSKLGLGLVAIRDDEDKAAGIGVVTPVYKSLAFMASAVLVGVAGAVYGYYVSFLTVSTMFDIVLSMQVVLAVLLGGRATVWGPVLGAFIVVPLAEVTNTSIGGVDAGAFRLIMFGGLLLLVTLALPRGIIPSVSRLLEQRRRGETSSLTGARLVETTLPVAPVSERVAVGSTEMLRVEDVAVQFGGVKALDGASLVVPAGSITALIGPNGSGKTTLFNVIDGTYSPVRGDVVLAGKSLAKLDRTGRAFAGIGRTYQLPRLFDSLTVLENVAAVNSSFKLRRLVHSAVSGAEAARATELLEFVGLGEYVQAHATDLSYGQRKLVELAQMLMLDPAVILLDEPAAGINPTLLRRLAALIESLNATGRTFVIVEHDMHFVLSLADQATVLAHGKVIASGEPAAVSTDPAVLEAYLGDDFVLEPTTIGTGS